MRGYCGIGVIHAKTEANIGTLFRSATVFEADFIYTVGRRYRRQASDTVKSFLHMPLYHFDTVSELKAHLPFGCTLVGIENTEDARMLDGFGHPERACYLLGAEDHGLTNEALGLCHSVIKIPGRFCLNVAVAGSIVLHDRYAKAMTRLETAVS